VAAFCPPWLVLRARSPIMVGAGRASAVAVCLWALTWAAETGFAAWVRHAVKDPPPQ
jgi:hypothetical protein